MKFKYFLFGVISTIALFVFAAIASISYFELNKKPGDMFKIDDKWGVKKDTTRNFIDWPVQADTTLNHHKTLCSANGNVIF